MLRLSIPKFKTQETVVAYLRQQNIPKTLDGYTALFGALLLAGYSQPTSILASWFDEEDQKPPRDATERSIVLSRTDIPMYQHDSGSDQQNNPTTELKDGSQGVRTQRTTWGSVLRPIVREAQRWPGYSEEAHKAVAQAYHLVRPVLDDTPFDDYLKAIGFSTPESFWTFAGSIKSSL